MVFYLNGSFSTRALLEAGLAGVGGMLLLATPALAQNDGSSGAVADSGRSQPGAQQQSATSVAQNRVEEIVVTARKQQESLQKVPVSVTAITANDLQRRSIANLASVGQSTPNLSFTQQGAGGRTSGVVYIRGIGQGDTLATYDPAVGIYIDGVYLGRAQANDLDMLDIERVEVLRGPQGTLFGKNTSGGAINIVTKQPDLTGFSGRAQVTVGSRDRFDLNGGLNVPLVDDKVALQVSVSRRRQDGYGHRILAGDDEGNTRRDSERGQLLVKPTENFSILLEADRTHFNETNAVMDLYEALTTGAPIAAINGLFAAGLTPLPYDNRWVTPGDFTTNGTGPNSNRGNIWGTAATITWGFSGATLKSITSYRHIHTHNDIDPDGSPLAILDQYNPVRQKQISQELQISGKSFDDKLNWVGGVYYFREVADDNTYNNVVGPLQPFGVDANFTQALHITNSSYAAYAQGTYNLTDKLRATVGIRYTKDDKSVVRSRFGFPNTSILIEPTTKKSRSSTAFSPRLGLDYQWTPTFMTYVSVAQGYKSGGFNGRAGTISDFNEFKDEKVLTYEAGFRSDLFDRKVRFNATAFYSDYRNLQVQISGSTTDPTTGNPVPFTIVTNIPKARIAGGEAELVVVPTTGLKLTGGLGLTYGKYIKLPTDPQFTAAPPLTKDSQFQNVPKATWTGAIEYTTALTPEMDIIANTNYTYKTTIFYNTHNTIPARQRHYGVLDARLTFEHKPSGVSLAVFGTNLTNKHYAVGAFDSGQQDDPALGFVFRNMAPPREWGLSAQVKF